MRVYEFAKKFGLSSKQVVSELDKAGVRVKNHMSVLDDVSLRVLEKVFSPKQKDNKKKDPSKNAQQNQALSNNKVLQSGEDVQLGQNKSKNKSKDKYVKNSRKSSFGVKKDSQKNLEPIVPAVVELRSMSVGDLSGQVQIPATEVIVTLLKWGIVATKNQIVGEDVVERVANHYEVPTKKISSTIDNFKVEVVYSEKDLQGRLPVVVIVGHVDHGKTTLLDFIRKTRVTAQEKGGITQHIGAYEAHTDQGNIVFIDTPGHEAFGKIRQRGIRAADIVILIVAADDGVMPQTVESIKRAKEMEVPIIVAINKIDRVDAAQIEVVKRQLAQYDVLPEDWGGDAICVPISAVSGQGVDTLLEMINLQAEMLELRASFVGPAQGYILESKLEKGRGSVATCILQGGTLRIGDYFTCGASGGRATTLTDSFDKKIIEITPALPVQIASFDIMPQVGDYLQVVSKEEYRKHRDAQKKAGGSAVGGSTKESVLRLLIKTDTNSSREALIDSIIKLSQSMRDSISIVSSGIGNITEGDVEFAFNTGAEIVGLHVKTEAKAAALASNRGVSVDLFDIIYKLLEDAQKRVDNRQEVEVERIKIGQATVLRVFNIKRIGVIAGCKVDDGRFVRDGYVIAYRNDKKFGEGKITSLQREKKSIQEVNAGYECGFVVEGITGWQEGDRVECYIEQEKK